MKRVLLRSTVAAAAAATVLVLLPAAASAATTYPVNTDVTSAYLTGVTAPSTSPAGSNVGCRPSVAHPEPVVLVHGTFENQNDNWQAASPILANAGYCVYSFTYGGTALSGGIDGIDDIPTGARALKTFVDKVLASTGARKVDLLGHSQGGMLPRYYIKYLGGASKVDQLIGLVPSNNGTTLDGITALTIIPGANAFLGVLCKACVQQEIGSDFITDLNAGGETVPGVKYTVVATTHDEVVTPYTNALLPPAPNVTQVVWQDICPSDPVGHVGTAYDTGILQYVLNTLDPSTAKPITCVSGFPL